MNRPDPQEQTDAKTQELQYGLQASQKRPSQVDGDEGTPSTQYRRVSSLDEQRLEARRASNRLSARRCRLRQKSVIREQEMTIRELKTGNASLQIANNTLQMKLNEALLQNHQLRLMMENEVEIMLEKNLSLQRVLERRIEHRTQGLPLESSRTTNPPLLQRTSTPSTLSYESLRLSRSVCGRGQEPVSERVHDELVYGKGSRTPPNAVNGTLSNAFTSPFPARESGQDASLSSANVQDKVPASVKVMYLQQEIKALKKAQEKLEERFQS